MPKAAKGSRQRVTEGCPKPPLFYAVNKQSKNYLKAESGGKEATEKNMRKITLCLLCCLLSLEMLAVSDRTVEITATLGVPFIITPYSDLGVSYTNVRLCYANDDDKTKGSYEISDSDGVAFSIVATEGNYRDTSIGNSPTYYYYSYQLTPTKTGFYIFKQKVTHIVTTPYGNVGATATMTYNITVVELTSISIPTSLTLSMGDNYTITPIFTHPQATTTLTWSSSNTTIADIDGTGIITTKGIGTTTITCTASNGVSVQCEVTVNPVLVSSITLNNTEAELTVGEKLQMEATTEPSNATDKSVTWSSTNEAVAVVDENGLVTAVGSGTCQIKATANDGSGKSASCLITVEKNNKLTVTDMTQCSGGRGVLNVLLTDEETIMGFQFDLELPEGVTVAEDADGKLMAALTGNAVNTHSISSSKVSDGPYRFIVTPQGSRAISQASGDGMTITIDVADDVAVGTYPMAIKNIEMTVKKTGNVYEDIHPKNSTATLTVTEATMGDVNGDGRVSVTDVISMNSYILEEEPAQFIRKVADLNGDGKVTITDMVQVIDIILGR